MLLPLFAIMISFISCQKEMKIKDERDGKTYEYVKIGSQYWMSENLRYKPENGIYWAFNDNEARGLLVFFTIGREPVRFVPRAGTFPQRPSGIP